MSDTIVDRADRNSLSTLGRYVEDFQPDLVLTVDNRDLAPDRPGIYFCWAADLAIDRPVYIGATVSIRARLRAWFGTEGPQRHPWPERIRFVTVSLFDREDLAEIERHEIESWGPIRNVDGIETPYRKGAWS